MNVDLAREPAASAASHPSLARSDRLRALALALAVGVAFADSSVVVLALPDLLGAFDTTIASVSWVVTAYNLVVAAVALALARSAGRLGPSRLCAAGIAVFLAASLLCALAPGLGWLIGFRAAQGLGGALLLAGALPLLGRLLRSTPRAAGVWALSGALGAALGPAAGGLLTEAFAWRSIFIAQLPLVAVAAVALRRRPPVELVALEPVRADRAGLGRRLKADLALGLVSGALVAALFLAVVLLIDGWGHSPATAALVVSAIPLGTLAARPLARGLSARLAATAGVLLLVGGLCAMALLPESSLALATLALTLCGLGLGLSVPELVGAGLGDGSRLARDGTWSVGVRHAGLVVGLVLLTPILSHDLTAAGDKARVVGTGMLLDAPLSLSSKVSLAQDLDARVREAETGDTEALWEPFRRREAAEPELRDLRVALQDLLEDSLTGGFRRSFLFSALLALLALPLVALLGGRRPDGPRGPALAATALLVLGAGGLVVGEVRAGGLDRGDLPPRDPCTSRSTFQGDGIEGGAQRIVLRGIDIAACELGVSREELVLELATGFSEDRPAPEGWEDAIRDGLEEAVDEEDLDRVSTFLLQQAVQRAPVDWVLEALERLGYI